MGAMTVLIGVLGWDGRKRPDGVSVAGLLCAATEKEEDDRRLCSREKADTRRFGEDPLVRKRTESMIYQR